MNINWDKFQEFRKKTGLQIEVGYTTWSSAEMAKMNLDITGNQDDIIKILNILMTHWDKKGKWR